MERRLVVGRIGSDMRLCLLVVLVLARVRTDYRDGGNDDDDDDVNPRLF